MKILEENKKSGEITIKIDNLNDLWSLYNIISKNDQVSARTQRRVIIREGTKGERKNMKLKLNVDDVSFHEFSNRLRVKGTILEGPEDFVSFGTYHTFNIEPGQVIHIIKTKWLKHEKKRLTEASKFESNYIMFFIAIETGLATLAIITNFSHKRITVIKTHIPGKRYAQANRNKALNEFFDNIVKVIEENIKQTEINSIIVCGPGNTRNHLIKHIKENYNPDYYSKIKSIHASSGTESAILETLKSKELTLIKRNVKVLEETEKIEEIFTLLSTDDDLIAIGFDEITGGAERGAIKDLFVADIMIRGTSKEQKLRIEDIIINVEKAGGKVHILSSEHPTGQQIIDLGSLIGILRYKF